MVTLCNTMSRENLNLDIGDESKVADNKMKKIQEELGFDKTKPMVLSADDQKDLDEKGDQFLSWYQEELQELYDAEQ